MRAIRVESYGGPEVLRIAEVPTPEPGAGQVRVKLAAAGVNFIDTYHRTGAYKGTLPFMLGGEGAGVVDAVGPGVAEFRPGDRVASPTMNGTYAEYALAAADRLVPVPQGVDLRVAAAALLQGCTAHYLSYSTFPLDPGKTALVHAAAGGVGRLLTQIATQLGARVLATAGSEEKAALARSAGADAVILYTEEDFEAETRKLTGGVGVDVVYDSVGKTTFDKSLGCLRPRGYLVLFGQSSGAVPPLDPQVLNAKGSLFLTRPTIAHYIATRDELLWRATDIFTWITQNQLEVRIDREFPLAEAAAAHRYLEERQTKGKVLLIP
ncbi:MAG TPA: quinone oxidoreductase [Ktedonobacterales bacterium]|nr:quinone oxidoreductase [Ktedonobacterales bacterium]